MKIKYFKRALIVSALLSSIAFADRTHGVWMNPDVGFTADMLTDINDVKGQYSEITSDGINIRSGELSIGANVDPYSKLIANLNFSTHGAAIHELYAWFPYLPGNLSLKTGYKLAEFGRWNRFHLHTMPFSADPRIYMEYFGGHFVATGAELSWMFPFDWFSQITLSVYDGIHGHTHDSDPSASSSALDQLAAELGYVKHGSHWHAPDGSIIQADDLQDPSAPTSSTTNKSPSDFAYGGRWNGSLEFGDNWSADFGASGVYQQGYLHSTYVEHQYPKGVIGTDLTFFWHPLEENGYRNMDFGAEWLLNYQGNEVKSGMNIYEEDTWRQGVFSHIHIRANKSWHFGAYGEFFQSNDVQKFLRNRIGLFTTYEISHYQYLRFEISRYEKSQYLNPVNRLTLQYDATIGYHSHGAQR